MQYLQCVCKNLINSYYYVCNTLIFFVTTLLVVIYCCVCNTFIAYVITLKVVIGVHVIPLVPLWYFSSSLIPLYFIIYLNIFIFPLVFLYFVGSRANVLHGVDKEGMILEKDEHRFICKVETCNAFYLAKYLLLNHSHQKHSLSTIPRKFKYPFIWQECINKWMGLKQKKFKVWHKGNCSTWMCHMWVGSLVEWCTMNKTNIETHIGKNCLFQVVHSIGHFGMGCAVYLPQM